MHWTAHGTAVRAFLRAVVCPCGKCAARLPTTDRPAFPTYVTATAPHPPRERNANTKLLRNVLVVGKGILGRFGGFSVASQIAHTGTAWVAPRHHTALCVLQSMWPCQSHAKCTEGGTHSMPSKGHASAPVGAL